MNEEDTSLYGKNRKGKVALCRPQAELLGIPDRFIGQGTQEQLRRICGFDLEGIYRTIMKSKK